ncbi:MAG: response regulator transcription factor [Thermodesulfovibrionales bacterium]|nr:response regulator transcription factor [Thermodesulfovibrionales bacterium]
MKKPLILIVDDDPDILRVLKANLELHNFSVLTAESCSSAKKFFSEKRPDLIILDIMLPDGDGVEICKEIRKKAPDLPIIMLTAKDKLSDKIIGLESGADDYIVKPFETLELIARIRACLRRTKPKTEELKIGNLVIDMKRREVKKSGKPVELTPKEYNILCYLAENRDRVVTRQELKEHLWKDNKLYSWSRVIDVHIMHLREKLEDNPSEPSYIITIPGAGYKFREE